MNSSARKIKIREIIKGKPVATGTKLLYQGEIREFDVYKIPIDFLAYNVENGRISSLVKSYKREYGTLDVDDENDSNKIAQFLYYSNEKRNKKTIENLAKNGQLEPGIITMDGVIVDGNRRASLLRKISNDNNYDQNTKDKCSYFTARILPEDADEREILRLETSFQMGADSKVDYNPIEKYLHARDMKEKRFTLKQIAEYMGFDSVKDVSLNLEVMELIDQYLETYGYTGLYTRLPRGCEDDLLKLNSAIKKVQSGRIKWLPENKLDEVEVDLRNISFDFIRLEEKGDFDFRAISSTANNNFLNDEKTWTNFSNSYNELIKDYEEEDIDSVIKKAGNEDDITRLLNQRDNKWKEEMREGLMETFNDSKNTIDNKKAKDKPEALLKKALNALTEIDLDTLRKTPNKLALVEQANLLKKLTENITEVLN
ncbi:hypothetical protein DSM03_101491 [Leeuwenhoekiella aestuarii]|uniref:hypothetical protein n=1 Tax=Leeuwenhoekiella aestuarii TaxID=2249426 RepID=UPI000FFE6EDF|nr:hypothetical protein [Leeuwenhoekiella aestuarii]RXG19122.1 hypothetical protein DSM03_101491 [Leeuwenhoekiella aestuarii]